MSGNIYFVNNKIINNESNDNQILFNNFLIIFERFEVKNYPEKLVQMHAIDIISRLWFEGLFVCVCVWVCYHWTWNEAISLLSILTKARISCLILCQAISFRECSRMNQKLKSSIRMVNNFR